MKLQGATRDLSAAILPPWPLNRCIPASGVDEPLILKFHVGLFRAPKLEPFTAVKISYLSPNDMIAVPHLVLG
jgi:hypothetical protein